MPFGLGVLFFVLGSVLVAVCLVAIPGPPGEAPGPFGHGHDHGGH